VRPAVALERARSRLMIQNSHDVAVHESRWLSFKLIMQAAGPSLDGTTSAMLTVKTVLTQ